MAPTRWSLAATDGWGNGPLQAHGDIVVDTAPPVRLGRRTPRAPRRCSRPTVTGLDGHDRVRGRSANEPGTVSATVRNAADAVVDQPAPPVIGLDGEADLGRPGRGRRLRARRHLLASAFVATGPGGQPQRRAGARRSTSYAALGYVATSQLGVLPAGRRHARRHDDSLVPAALGGDRDLDHPGLRGPVVRTHRSRGLPWPPARTAFTWNGRNDAGAIVPRGTYAVVVTATDGTLPATQRATGRRRRVQDHRLGHDPGASPEDHRHGDQRGGPRHHADAAHLPARDRRLTVTMDKIAHAGVPGDRHAQGLVHRDHEAPRSARAAPAHCALRSLGAGLHDGAGQRDLTRALALH